MAAAASPKRHERTVSLTRLFDAPRQDVFACWIRAEHLANWFGPEGFAIHSVEADARPGGLFRLCMRSPDGKDYWVRGEYREVVVPERLVIFCTADDENGVTRLEETIHVDLSESGGKTRLSLTATAAGAGGVAAGMLGGMEQGWAETIDRLAASVAKA